MSATGQLRQWQLLHIMPLHKLQKTAQIADFRKGFPFRLRKRPADQNTQLHKQRLVHRPAAGRTHRLFPQHLRKNRFAFFQLLGVQSQTVAETVFLLKRHIVFKEDVVSDGIGQISPFPPPLMQMENQIGNGEIFQLLISVRRAVRNQKHISPPDRIGPVLRHMHSLPRTDDNQFVKIMVVPAVRKLIPVVLRRTADRKGPEIFFRNQKEGFLHDEGILFFGLKYLF